jgi:hypothetical protein
MPLIVQQLSSTAISEWVYDEDEEELDVLFTDASSYRFDVDLSTWNLLQLAPSKGKALNALVLDTQRGTRLF